MKLNENWVEVADKTYGAMTCPECFGEVKKDYLSNYYQCQECGEFFDSDSMNDLYKEYKRLKNIRQKRPSPNQKYVVYAEGTWDEISSTALFKRLAGPAQWDTEADADKFSISQAEKATASINGKYKWVKKRV